MMIMVMISKKKVHMIWNMLSWSPEHLAVNKDADGAQNVSISCSMSGWLAGKQE